MTGKCLRHLRERAGVVFKEVATKIDVSPEHLALQEREDKTIKLPLAAWFKLSEILGVPIDKLPR